MMDTLMTLVLITGQVYAMATTHKACASAREALGAGGIVMVQMENGFVVEAKRAACEPIGGESS